MFYIITIVDSRKIIVYNSTTIANIEESDMLFMLTFAVSFKYIFNSKKLIAMRKIMKNKNTSFRFFLSAYFLPVFLVNTSADDLQNEVAVSKNEWYYTPPDTNVWRPDVIYIVYPEVKFKIKAPYENEQSGLSNLFFHCKETGIYFQPDSMSDKKWRKYSKLKPGNYEISLLYDDGKYIRSNDFLVEEKTELELDLLNCVIKQSDTLSQNLLSRRSISEILANDYRDNWRLRKERMIKNNPNIIDRWQKEGVGMVQDTTTVLYIAWKNNERIIWKDYIASSDTKVRGYVFTDINGYITPDDGMVSYVDSEGILKRTKCTLDVYFEIDVDKDASEALTISLTGHIEHEINMAANSLIFIVIEDDRSKAIISHSHPYK